MERGMRQDGQLTDKKQHPFLRSGGRNKAPVKTTPRASILFALFIVSVCFCAAEGRPDKGDFWNKDLYKNNNYFDSDKDEDREVMDTIVSIIVGIIVFVISAISVCLICICCPICFLAKARSRRRGIVYRSAVTENGTTVTTTSGRGGTTILVSGPPRNAAAQHASLVQAAPPHFLATSNPNVVAISNNTNNKPYPVQSSVTVIPNPNTMTYASQPQVPYQMMPHHQAYPGANDLPPPYPGITREADGSSPYNPYFTENQASAPAYKQ